MEPLSNLLYSVFRGTQSHGSWMIACLEDAWPKLLGERLAAVCRPVRIENADLQIKILDREWEQAVRSVKQELLEKLRTATSNEVKTISFSRQPSIGSRQY